MRSFGVPRREAFGLCFVAAHDRGLRGGVSRASSVRSAPEQTRFVLVDLDVKAAEQGSESSFRWIQTGPATPGLRGRSRSQRLAINDRVSGPVGVRAAFHGFLQFLG